MAATTKQLIASILAWPALRLSHYLLVGCLCCLSTHTARAIESVLNSPESSDSSTENSQVNPKVTSKPNSNVTPNMSVASQAVIASQAGSVHFQGRVGAGVSQSSPNKSTAIEATDPFVLPVGRDEIGLAVKPGHWYQANQKLTAKEREEILVSNARLYGLDRKPIPTYSGYGVSVFRRELDLAPKQSKNIRLQFLQPESAAPNVVNDLSSTSSTNLPYLGLQLLDRKTGNEIYRDEFPLRFLQGYQYSLVTLSKDPSRQIFWHGLRCIHWPSEVRDDRIVPHRIVNMSEEDLGSLFPNRFYAMTSVSHIVISDLNLSLLAKDQQTALLDWLYFGGTLIISGPEANASVETSFLRSYVPLKRPTTVDWSEKETERLNDHWSIAPPGEEPKPFVANADLSLLIGELASEAQWVPNLEGLVAERLVGQGRVVQSTFSLADRAFLGWPSYDSLIHNGIFRKPRREVRKAPNFDTNFAGEFRGDERNPRHSTRLRIWARDLDSSTVATKEDEWYRRNFNSWTNSDPIPLPKTFAEVEGPLARGTELVDESDGLATRNKRTSYGAWNHNSSITKAARESLQVESGISAPRIKTILYLLGGYLICLVPLNWLVFRLIGRVEFAWIAAPFIALLGSVAVAKVTEIDIGFSRSQHTYEVLECHRNHTRGLLTGYHSLYTSLSTNYQATFEEDRGIVTPLFTPKELSSQRTGFVSNIIEFMYGGPTHNGLLNYSILSNTLGMLHSEEMVELNGDFDAVIDPAANELRLVSNLPFPVLDLGVIGRDQDGSLKRTWVGNLDSQEEWIGEFERGASRNVWFKEWNQVPIMSEPRISEGNGRTWQKPYEDTPENEGLYQGPLLELLLKNYPLGRGEYIALGRVEESLSSMRIEPTSDREKHATLILLHLAPEILPSSVEPDVNLYPNIVPQKSDGEMEGEVAESEGNTGNPPAN